MVAKYVGENYERLLKDGDIYFRWFYLIFIFFKAE